MEMRGQTDCCARGRYRKCQPVRLASPASAQAAHTDPEQRITADPEREARKRPQIGRQQLLFAVAGERRRKSQEEEAARENSETFIPRRLPAGIKKAERADEE
ncbi:hypothetical protein D9M70_416040 [compost metagenome]